MSDRKQTTKDLSDALEVYIGVKDPRTYWAKEVTFDYGTSNQVRVDYMRFKPANNSVSGIEKGDVYCYEIKSCVDDFNSKNGHNFVGDYNYYVMPGDVLNKVSGKIGFNIGVLCPRSDGSLECAIRAKRHNRERPLSEVLLMMFRSANREYASRLRGVKEEEHPNVVEVARAYWIPIDGGLYPVSRCSNPKCARLCETGGSFPYCPNCGARMDGGDP